MRKRTLQLKKLLAVLLIFSIFSVCCTSAYAESTTSSIPAAQELAVAETEEAEPLALSTVPDAVGAEKALAAGHVKRLYSEENSPNEVVFENADGTHTLYLFDYPVKYTDKNGKTQDVSLKIENSTAAGVAFESGNGNVQTTFAAKMTDGVTLAGDDVSIKMVPLVPNVQSGVTIDGVLQARTAQRVNDKKIAYAYDSKTTLEYTLTYTGFKEEIVVEEYTGQTVYPFVLYTNGLALTEMDGSYFLCDETGEIRATIGDIIIFTADERNNALGELTAQTIKENEIYGVTIHVDDAYLQDENTAYPIRIDPTIEITSESGSSAILDATINSKAVSAGTSTSLYIGNRQTYGITRILMQFPGLGVSNLPAANNITSATVEIRDVMCEAASMTVYAHVFSGGDWNEASVDWTSVNPNNYESAALSSKVVSYANGAALSTPHRYSFNILDAVKGWKSGVYNQDNGILFKTTSTLEGSTTYQQKTFASFNRASYQPSLEVVYNGIVVTPSVTTLNIGGTRTLSCTADGGTVTWSSSNTRIASVNSSTGKVTAKACGQATITARWTSGSQSATATCTVTVNPNTNIAAGLDNGQVYRIRSVSDSTKCLTASSASTIGVTTYNASDLKQQWYIKKTGNYYTLENLGLKLSDGTYQYILNAKSTSALEMSSNSAISTAEKWDITVIDEDATTKKYYITSLNYRARKLYKSGTSAILSTTESTASQWTFEKVDMSGYAWGGGYEGHNPETDVLTVNLILQQSLFDAGLTEDIFQAATRWNDSGANIQITVKKYNASNIPSAKITVNVEISTDFFAPSQLAYTAPILSDTPLINPTEYALNSEWVSATIFIGEIFISYSREEQEKTIIHETGHVLKLQHPHDAVSNYYPYAVMCQSQYSQHTLSLSGHDKAALITKWGVKQ